MSGFVHLRVHTEYSVSSSVVRIPQLIEATKEQGGDCVAVNDTDNLFGSLKFSSAAAKAGIKPIIGADVQLAMPARHEEDSGRLTLLCASREGYLNLCRLITQAYDRSRQGGRRDGAPTISYSELKEARAGLLALSGGSGGIIGACLAKDREDRAAAILRELRDCFADRLYLSVERIDDGEPERRHLEFCVIEGKRLGVALVATNNVHFIRRQDYTSHKVRVGINQNLNINSPELESQFSPSQYLRPPTEMAEVFADIPEALANSAEIARRCNFFLIPSSKPHMPKVEIPGGATPEDHLRSEAAQRLESILKSDARARAKAKEYRERLAIELDIIVKMGYAAYYLIVEEFVNWARSNSVMVGPGRGSGPGSLVAYAMDITRIDPMRYELLFERFLNPERISLPDFDIDFDDHRRDAVIAHVAELYGRDQVSQIITFGTMGARAAIRDAGRTLGKTYGHCDRISRLVPSELDITLAKAMNSQEFADECKDPETREIIDRALEIEGLARNPGRHAGGVVIAPEPLTSYCPLYRDEEGNAMTQFDMKDLEAIGLIKYDFLGLRSLSTIRDALDNIKALGGGDIDIDAIDLADKETFKLINKQRTLGVFQLESSGMRELIGKLKPDSFEDIIALLALFRPGPIESGIHDIFCERKNGRAQISYYHRCLQPVLEPTYGVFIYQEQVMQAAQVMAGYSLGGADVMRRGIGKKLPEVLAEQRPIFIKGCMDNNVSEKVAAEVFDIFVKFGDYGFNKSHSAAYAIIAFQTAWLKSHHACAYMASLMTNEPDHANIARMIHDCASMGIAVLRPDINESEPEFRPLDTRRLRYGLGRIKGVGAHSRRGDSFVEQVCEERRARGPFKSFTEFLVRVPLAKCNSKTLIALIGSGVFDSFAAEGDHLRQRLVLIDAVESNIVEFAQAQRAAIDSGQSGLFGGAGDGAGAEEFQFRDVARNDRRALAHEYEALNFYLGEHPLSYLRESSPDLARLPRLAGLRQAEPGWCLFEIRDVATARRGKQLTVSCDDEDSNAILFFPIDKAQASESNAWKCKKRIVLAHIDQAGSRPRIGNLFAEEEMRTRFCLSHEFALEPPAAADPASVFEDLAKALDKADAGRTRILFSFAAEGGRGTLELGKRVKLDADLFEALSEHPACSPARSRYDFP